jgi:hypothetical protein
MLVRKYNAQLCFTPMISAKLFVNDKTYRASHFQSLPADRPLVAQLCGHQEDELVAAAQLLVGKVVAIDLNFGSPPPPPPSLTLLRRLQSLNLSRPTIRCPENIAKKGGYGAFLLQKPDVVLRIVRHLATAQVHTHTLFFFYLYGGALFEDSRNANVVVTTWL